MHEKSNAEANVFYDFLKLNNQTERNCEFRKSSFNWMEKELMHLCFGWAKMCPSAFICFVFRFCLIVYCEKARFNMVLNTMFMADVPTFLVRMKQWRNSLQSEKKREKPKFTSKSSSKQNYICLFGSSRNQSESDGNAFVYESLTVCAHNIFDKCHKIWEKHTKQKRFNHSMAKSKAICCDIRSE